MFKCIYVSLAIEEFCWLNDHLLHVHVSISQDRGFTLTFIAIYKRI